MNEYCVLYLNNYEWELYKKGFKTFDEAVDFIMFAEAQTGLIGAFSVDSQEKWEDK